MSDRGAIVLLLLLTSACNNSRTACQTDEVFRDGSCEPYQAGEPVTATVWTPAQGTSWQWQITGQVDTSLPVQMYDVDLFDVSDAALRALSDRTVICYFSAGSHEAFREDARFVSSDAIGRKLAGWPDERWLDVMHPDTRALVIQRLDHAVERGCDGVEPDNVTAVNNRSGFPITPAEQLDFNRFIADEAHRRGLSVGLKNDFEQIDALEPWFDWALNEECLQFDECGRYDGFLATGKAVFHTEYGKLDQLDALATEVCSARPDGFSTLLKTLDLGSEWVACP